MLQRITLCVTLLAGAVGAQNSRPQGTGVIDLLQLGAQSPSEALPPAWQVRAVRGKQAPMSAIVDSSGDRFLRLKGLDRAAFFVRRLEMPLTAVGQLEWRWRAPVAPSGASLSAVSTDDAVLRVFVVFARHGRFATTPRTLFYSLADGLPPEPRPGPRRQALASLAAGSPALARGWVRVQVDPFADYRRLWQADATEIVAIGVMQDTDQTRTAAIGDLMQLLWRKNNVANP
jgi:hypothetical protein